MISVFHPLFIDHPIISEQRRPGQAEALCLVAGARHDTQGKIQLPVFLAEIGNSTWKVSSFLLHKNTSKPIRFLEPIASQLQSSEIKMFLSGISLITEITLD